MHADEQAIRDLVQTWLKASSSGDLDQVLSLTSDDVVFHTPGREPFGKEEFAAATRVSAGKVQVEGKADVREVQVSDDMAFCRVHLQIALFKFNEAVSFQVLCDTQDEINSYWAKLSEGGDPKAQQCGWLKDRFGLSWQVVPRGMAEMLQDPASGEGLFGPDGDEEDRHRRTQAGHSGR